MQNLQALLDEAYEAVVGFDNTALRSFLQQLNIINSSLGDESDFLALQCAIREHRVFPRLLEDPYTYHAFTKPRGFAGDASLIDLFYGHRSGREAVTAAGRFIFESLMSLPSCDSVRYRRGYYGAFIDQHSQGEDSELLVLACGHLREALFSSKVTGRSARIIGIDSDPLAVAEAKRSLGHLQVELKNASIVDFIRRKAWGKRFDAIYAAGLFDYLNIKIGRKVISTAFDALKTGGVLSIANFLPDIIERGYMDIVMDWRLIYRTPEDMFLLTQDVPERRASVNIRVDPLTSVVYLEITKL